MLCLLLFERRKRDQKKREKWPGTFVTGPEVRHALLAVLGGIFAAVRYN
jgi:hypothetical protein